MRTKFIIATGVAAGVLLLAGCGDAPTAAGNAPELRAAKGASPNESVSSDNGAQSVELVVSTTRDRSYRLPGGHKVTFPARSICDLAASSYGPTEWDRPCVPQRGTVTIWATVRTDSSGHPAVDFEPRMRFNPAAGPVILKMKDAFLTQTDRGILYCPDAASPCVDESLTDPSLVTYSEAGGTAYSRRIKHFSGYNVAIGRSVRVTSLMQ